VSLALEGEGRCVRVLTGHRMRCTISTPVQAAGRIGWG